MAFLLLTAACTSGPAGDRNTDRDFADQNQATGDDFAACRSLNTANSGNRAGDPCDGSADDCNGEANLYCEAASCSCRPNPTTGGDTYTPPTGDNGGDQGEPPACINETPGTGAPGEPCRFNTDCDNAVTPEDEGFCNLVNCRCA